MQQPVNHHWLPQFLMRPWCGDDGLVTSFFRPYKNVVAKRKSPKSLGSNDDLYTIRWVKMDDPYFMEKHVFTETFDTPSAKTRDKMFHGEFPDKLSMERTDFSTFLIMLMIRKPDLIEEKRKILSEEWRKTIENLSYPDGDNKKFMSNHEFETFYKKWFDGFEDYIIMYALLESASKSAYIPMLSSLEWTVYDVSSGGFDLVLGDNPLQMWSRNGEIERVTLPLSPIHLFVAGTPTALATEPTFNPEFRQVLALDNVVQQFQKANKFVIARNLGPKDRLLKLAERKLKMPDGSLPSDVNA
jgi:hypothetical protein